MRTNTARAASANRRTNLYPLVCEIITQYCNRTDAERAVFDAVRDDDGLARQMVGHYCAFVAEQLAKKRKVSPPVRLVPTQKARTLSERHAAVTAAAMTAQRIFDTIKVRDGRSIGEVRWHEIDGLIAANANEATLLRLIKNRYARNSVDSFATIRDMISEQELARLQKKAIADVAEATNGH